MKAFHTMKLRRYSAQTITITTAIVMIFTSTILPVSVWANDVGIGEEPPSTTEDIRSFLTNTPWYDPTDGSCESGRSAESYGSWDALALTYPQIPDQAALIAKVRQYIQRPGAYPRSPFASNPERIESIFSLSNQHNVNPLLILSMAKQENQFGSVGSAALEKNNYFGITFSDNGVKTYRTFATPEAGIEYFVKDVSDNISDQNGLYRKRGLTNFYEYLNIHQMGFIAYPGEYPPAAPGANATPPYLFEDSLMNVRVTWESPYNPGNYYKNSISFINALTGMSLSETPSKAGAGECGQAEGGVNADGYSWPLDPQKKIKYNNYGGLPSQGCASGPINLASGGDWPDLAKNKGKTVLSCHSAFKMPGRSVAFDLFYGGQNETAGAAVYAITDGSVIDINYQSGTCHNLYLRGKDNYIYWYGHITKIGKYTGGSYTAVGVGGQFDVVAGQKIAVVDTWSKGHCNNSSGRDHLHIDRGCVVKAVPQYGGGSCRDPDFMAIMESIYQTLPN